MEIEIPVTSKQIEFRFFDLLAFSIKHWRLTAEINRRAIQRYFQEKVFWKYAATLQENTNAEVQFQQSYFATLLKSHFRMGVLL